MPDSNCYILEPKQLGSGTKLKRETLKSGCSFSPVDGNFSGEDDKYRRQEGGKKPEGELKAWLTSGWVCLQTAMIM